MSVTGSNPPSSGRLPSSGEPESKPVIRQPPVIPDHELIRRVGHGSYGDVWLARSLLGPFRAVKIVYRDQFQSTRPFERELAGIRKFEPISRLHESQVDILHIGQSDQCFFYVMELADDQKHGQNSDPGAY